MKLSHHSRSYYWAKAVLKQRAPWWLPLVLLAIAMAIVAFSFFRKEEGCRRGFKEVSDEQEQMIIELQTKKEA